MRIEGVADLIDTPNLDGFLSLDDAIVRLETVDAQAASVVRLRFYAGLPFAEVASCLGCREASARAGDGTDTETAERPPIFPNICTIRSEPLDHDLDGVHGGAAAEVGLAAVVQDVHVRQVLLALGPASFRDECRMISLHRKWPR